jgi:hypothetical protein
MGGSAIDDAGEIELGTHAFVVKIWRENDGAGPHGAVWRGQITHVASGRRGYVASLRQLILFIVPYLWALNVRMSLFWRLYQWLKR